MRRPEGLAEFGAPPLNEVVLGIQFNSPTGYTILEAGRVWDLFRDRFPKSELQAPLPPMFETFGSPLDPSGPQFSFMQVPDHPRFWFLDQSGANLLQFQPDRLLRNWRQVDGQSVLPYPRFESLSEEFRGDAGKLIGHLQKLTGDRILINQVEVSYISRIYGDSPNQLPDVNEYFRGLSLSEPIENFRGGFTRAIEQSGRPIGRLHFQVNSGRDVFGRPLLLLDLTFRGAPSDGSIGSALDLLAIGREIDIQTFTRMTTESAHKKWQRAQ